MQNTKKVFLSINDYLLKIRGFVDLLAQTGYSLSAKDHIDAIFDGLPSEYDAFIMLINSDIDPCSVDDIEYLLLTQKTRIEKNNKALDSANPSANLNMGSVQDAPHAREGKA